MVMDIVIIYIKTYGTTSVLWPLFMVPITKIFGNQLATWKLTACMLAFIKSIVLFAFLSP